LFLRTKISELPSFDLFYATILLVVILPSFLIFIYARGLDRRSVGIPVQIVRPTRFGKVSDACKRLPFFRLDFAGWKPPARVYVNSEPVFWERLEDALKEQLKSRPDRTVCFYGEPNVSWADAAAAMDVVRRLPARVLLAPDKRVDDGHKTYRTRS